MNRRWERYPGFLDYVSFEPEGDAFEELQGMEKEPRGQATFSAEPAALSDRPGSEHLNVYSSPDLSSFLDIDTEITHRYRNSNLTLSERAEVRTDTIDNVSKKRRQSPDFICLDTQGTELFILRGAEQCLKNSVLGLRCEVEFLPLYKNQPLFDQVFGFLLEKDFRLVTFQKTGSGAAGISTDGGPFSLTMEDAFVGWADAVFVKNHEKLFPENGAQAELATRLMKYVYFNAINDCGSLGLDLIYRLARQDRLTDMLEALPAEDLDSLLTAVQNHLEALKQASWQEVEFYNEWYAKERDFLGQWVEDFRRQRNLRLPDAGIKKAS